MFWFFGMLHITFCSFSTTGGVSGKYQYFGAEFSTGSVSSHHESLCPGSSLHSGPSVGDLSGRQKFENEMWWSDMPH